MPYTAETFAFLPDDAHRIRETVFILEQGFENEYDEIDNIATHIVLYKDNEAIGTCRIFDDDGYVLGRLAVLKAFRGFGAGKRLLKEAENQVRVLGGKSLRLHSQLQAKGFYEKCGYCQFGDIEFEQDCPHIWMKKTL